MLIILLACFLGALPDLIEAPYYFLKKDLAFVKNLWIPFKKKIQADTDPFWGIFNQLVVILAALLWIFG